MKPSLRILHVEDSADDAELVAFALRDAPFEAVIVRVDTEPEFTTQLEAHAPEAVICDFDMPRFTASRALEILQERRLEIPSSSRRTISARVRR
jgi:CheY-like chemotaxis protein